MLQFQVNGQSIDRIDDSDVRQDSIQYLKALFTFDESWFVHTSDGHLTSVGKTALFGGDVKEGSSETYKTYKVLLDDKGMCKVPDELKNTETIYVSVYGNGEEEGHNIRITTDKCKIKNKVSGFVSDDKTTNAEPETISSDYENLVSAIAEKLPIVPYKQMIDDIYIDIASHIINNWDYSVNETTNIYNRRKNILDTNMSELTLNLIPFDNNKYQHVFSETDSTAFIVVDAKKENEYFTEYYIELKTENELQITFKYNNEEVDDVVYISNYDEIGQGATLTLNPGNYSITLYNGVIAVYKC